ncbi:MAG: hypothetical protein ABSG36_07310 [Acidimicrobiales bacterium]|jgi:hypothetical protein
MDENPHGIDHLFKETARHAAGLAEALEPTKAVRLGSKRRVRARRRKIALSGAVVLAAVVIFLVPLPQLHLFGSSPRRVATSSSSTTSLVSGSQAPATGIPKDFQPGSFTAVSLDEWWLLGTARCGSGFGVCDSILRTTDGGANFAGIASPPVSATDVTQLRFANALDGYAFDPELWETTNGGANWTKIPTRGPVTQLEAADGEAYALGCTAANCPGTELLRAAIGSLGWQRVPTPIPLSNDPNLALNRKRLYLLAGEINPSRARAFLLYSDNKAARFTTRVDPCSAVLGGSVAAAADGTSSIWAACPTGTEAETWQSVDGATSWAAKQGGFPNSVQLAAASSSIALASRSQAKTGIPPDALERTTNGGRSFSVVLSESAFHVAWIGFSDAMRAYALFESDDLGAMTTRLYESEDAGATWNLVVIKS